MRHRFYGILTMASAAALLGLANLASAQPFGPGMGGGYGMMGGGGYGPGHMMGPGMMGPGMMGGGYGPGYMMGPGMMGGYGQGQMMGPGYGGPGMMGGYGAGYYRNQGNLNLSADDVKKFMKNMMRNPNLKVGEVKEKDADTITAEIVTKDKDALVQRFEFNRHNGYFQPE